MLQKAEKLKGDKNDKPRRAPKGRKDDDEAEEDPEGEGKEDADEAPPPRKRAKVKATPKKINT